MSLLTKGMNAVMDDVAKKVDLDPRVIDADKELNATLSILEKVLGYELYVPVEEAINAARSADTSAAFRLGITEGLRLANDVRALLGPTGGGEV
ncbi:hypothetical protein [Cohnella silvisoli]|uniref:Uncharacterized protein n=1 Tax=Cohnella silvisoli TaxID=2873699 RepID=A0ABV1L2Y0_9BACL|nr:hypothetical protein [Cohnella silvisoli]MCD9026023.1 hypothetical protein [Cohnella silvisoli]